MTKKILLIGMLLMVLMFIISCGPQGGTIILQNGPSDPTWSVAIGTSKDINNATKATLKAGEKFAKTFDTDGTYYAFGYFGGGWIYKAISLSGGETVTLKTRSDFN